MESDKLNWKKHISKGRLIDFPALQMLITSIKNNVGHLIVKSKPEDGGEGPVDKLISIGSTPSNYDINIIADKNDILNNLTAAMCRSGLLRPYNIDGVSKKLMGTEDLILGLDTNMLYNCVISEHLLNSLERMNPYSYSSMPKWLLLAVPGVVMKEIENAANHKKKGRLTHIGRLGFRALQEMMVLQENKGNTGHTVLVIGTTNPQQLRYTDDESSRLENADSLIRDQFRNFIREMDVRKGTYFLTMDKTNASLGRAEGLNAIRVQHPKMLRSGYDLHQLKGDTILLARILYEIAVEFGMIEISWKEHGRLHYLELDSGWQWKNMGHWENWQLLCSNYDNQFFQKVNNYENLPINRITSSWEKTRDSMI